MRFRQLVLLPLPAIWLLIAQFPSVTTCFVTALRVIRKPLPSPPPLQARQPKQSIGMTALSCSDTDQSTAVSKEVASPQSSGSSTIPQEVFNLVKSIIGAGALSLPAGVALMASHNGVVTSNGILLSTSCMLITLMGCISAYTFSLIARVCKITNSDTYADCWTATKGKSLAWIVALSSALDCFAGNLTFSMVLADTFRELLSTVFKVGADRTNYAGFFSTLGAYNSRSRILLTLTATVLFPLCCVKNLSTLAPFSLVGILGLVYTAMVIGLRCFDGSYKLPDGKFLADLGSVPSFAGETASGGGASFLQPFSNPKSLILVSLLSTAYIAHFNAPKFYRELKDVDTDPKRFHIGVVTSSFTLSFLFYILIACLGYLTFGLSTKGMVLSNYSTNDILISLSRFAVGLSLIFSYPLLFVGLRDGIVDLINQVSPFISKKMKKTKPPTKLVLTDQQSDRLTVGLVSMITIIALKIKSITFVASMSGALLGTALIFIFPPLMFRSALAMESERTNKPFTRLQRVERTLCSIIVGLGVFIAGVGTKMAWTA